MRQNFGDAREWTLEEGGCYGEQKGANIHALEQYKLFKRSLRARSFEHGPDLHLSGTCCRQALEVILEV